MVWASPPRESEYGPRCRRTAPGRLCGNVLHAPQRLSASLRRFVLRRRGGWVPPDPSDPPTNSPALLHAIVAASASRDRRRGRLGSRLPVWLRPSRQRHCNSRLHIAYRARTLGSRRSTGHRSYAELNAFKKADRNRRSSHIRVPTRRWRPRYSEPPPMLPRSRIR